MPPPSLWWILNKIIIKRHHREDTKYYQDLQDQKHQSGTFQHRGPLGHQNLQQRVLLLAGQPQEESPQQTQYISLRKHQLRRQQGHHEALQKWV